MFSYPHTYVVWKLHWMRTVGLWDWTSNRPHQQRRECDQSTARHQVDEESWATWIDWTGKPRRRKQCQARKKNKTGQINARQVWTKTTWKLNMANRRIHSSLDLRDPKLRHATRWMKRWSTDTRTTWISWACRWTRLMKTVPNEEKRHIMAMNTITNTRNTQ